MSNDFQKDNPYAKPAFPVHQESWLRRNGLWFIPLMIFVVSVPLFCCGSMFFTARMAMHLLTAPREAALEAMEKDQRIVDRIGSPMTSDNTIQLSDMHITNDNGDVEIGFNARGPKGSADVSGKMLLTNGVWSPDKLDVTFDDGTELTIPAGEAGEAAEAAEDD